jgi:hypothetical protein
VRATIKQVTLSIYFFAAGVAADFARWLMRDPRTTAVGVAGALAYVAARFDLVLGETASEWIVVLTLIAIAKLARDSHFDPEGRRR